MHRPIGVAGIAIASFLYQAVLVVVDAQLQAGIEGRARATVTSVASLGVDLCSLVLYAAWALDQPALLAATGFARAAALPALLRPHQREGRSPVLDPK